VLISVDAMPPPSSSSEIDGSTVVAEAMGHGEFDIHWWVAYSFASCSETSSMTGGGGQMGVDVHSCHASPNPMPPRKRGRLRKASEHLMPNDEVPTGALNTETQRETAVGGGHFEIDTQWGCASPTFPEIGSNAVADGMGHEWSDSQKPHAHPIRAPFRNTGTRVGWGRP
jgi:hypothetical protein